MRQATGDQIYDNTKIDTYVKSFGHSSWELDAIEPAQLAELVETVVLNHRDEDLWGEAVDREMRMKDALLKFARGYEEE